MAVKRTKSGKIDKRTKEGKAMLDNLAKARAAAAKAAGAWHFLRVGVNITSTCCKARQEPMYLSDKLKKGCQLSFCPTIGRYLPC